MAVAFSKAVWPWASLQARKTYQAYHTESMNAEAKLREAERQEEKRAGRSGAAATAAAVAAAATTTTTNATEAGPLRKTSLKKGSRLVEKVGLEGICLSPKALAPGLCLHSPWPSPGPAGRRCMEGEGRAEDGKATDLRQVSKRRACAWSALLALEGSPSGGGRRRGQEDGDCLPHAPSCSHRSAAGAKGALALPSLRAFLPTLLASHSAVRFPRGEKTRRMDDSVTCRDKGCLRWPSKRE